MVSLAGLADLARDAAAGTIRQLWMPSRLPRLTYWSIDPKLTVGVDSLLHIKTRYAGGAYLRALQADGNVLHDGPVAPHGHVGLTPQTPALVRLVLTLTRAEFQQSRNASPAKKKFSRWSFRRP